MYRCNQLVCVLSILFILSLRTVKSAGYGDACYGNDCCDSYSGLMCLHGLCVCKLPTMQFFPNKGMCLAGIGSACFVDGTTSCVDNAECTVVDEAGQCQCNQGFTQIAAKDCQNPDQSFDFEGTPYPFICCLTITTTTATINQ